MGRLERFLMAEENTRCLDVERFMRCSLQLLKFLEVFWMIDQACCCFNALSTKYLIDMSCCSKKPPCL